MDGVKSALTPALWSCGPVPIAVTVCDLSNGGIPIDLERTVTLFSRSHHSLTLNISQTVTDTAIVTIESEYKTVPKRLNGTNFNDFELPVTQISRSRKYLMLNIALMVQKRHYIYADNGYLVRTSALLIGVILNDLERAGVTCKIFS